MTENHDPKASQVYARDRASVTATAVVTIIRDWVNEPELRARLAAYLRQEFRDLEAQVLSDNRTDI
jgi:hypothetical protein